MQTTKLISMVALAAVLGGCDWDPLIHQDDAETQDLYRAQAQGWMHWALEQPWSTGPVLDDDGSACAVGQSGDTWFLAGTTGGPVTRSCTVPRGKRLFFPLLNRWAGARPDQIDTPEKLQGFLDFIPLYLGGQREATCQLTLRIDGEDLLPDLAAMEAELYTEQATPFEVELGDDNYTGGAAQIRHSVVGGHWALLRPLPPGDYTLEFGGATCDGGEVDFEVSATYELHVERGHHGHGGHGGDDDD